MVMPMAQIFKVLEESNGSTVIFCQRTNQLLLVEGKRASITTPPRVKMGRPVIPLTVTNTSQNASVPQSPGIKKPSACVLPFPRLGEPASQKVFKKEIFSSSKPEFSDLDYSDDCITKEQFFQVMNLVAKNKLSSEGPSNAQKTDFPLRHISKRSEKINFTSPSLAKVYDEVDLTSPLGRRWLNDGQTNSGNIISEDTAIEYSKKYSFYCRVTLSGSIFNEFDVPKLRCRVAKSYPETFRPQKNIRERCHMYSFTKRQRLERMKVLVTGLNSKSRKLKRLVRPCSVEIHRLNPKVIREWTSKKPCAIVKNPPQDSQKAAAPIADCSTTSEALPRTPVTSQLQETSVVSSENPQRRRFIRTRKCFVRLLDIKNCIYYQSGAYHIRGTSIRIKEYAEKIANQLKPSSSSSSSDNIIKVLKDDINVKGFPSHDHPYHKIDLLPVGRVQPKTSGASGVTNGSLVKRLVLQSVPQSVVVRGVATANCHPPVIDLTDDSEVRVMVPHHQIVQYNPFSLFVFHCFGCQLKQSVANKDHADIMVQQHMKGFHSVLQPDMFVQCKPDYGKKILYIEAFPGYKRDGKF